MTSILPLICDWYQASWPHWYHISQERLAVGWQCTVRADMEPLGCCLPMANWVLQTEGRGPIEQLQLPYLRHCNQSQSQWRLVCPKVRLWSHHEMLQVWKVQNCTVHGPMMVQGPNWHAGTLPPFLKCNKKNCKFRHGIENYWECP